jgi:DNA processing protein
MNIMNDINELILALILQKLPTKYRRVAKEHFNQNQSINLKTLKGFGIELSDYIAKAYDIERDCKKLNIGIKHFFEADYPINDNTVADCPFVLFYKGQWSECLNDKICLAIVGSRNADTFALDFTKKLSATLSKSATIVSGLALGIDASAHQGAVSSNLSNNNIAVLAHGLDQLYPVCNKKIAERMLEQGGLLISQFPPFTKPRPQNFLIRNSIIAGLSKAVIVIQASERSGSLVTARFALETGKDVLAVPGNINDLRFKGTNKLIQQGAHLITSADDVFSVISELPKPSDNSSGIKISDKLSEFALEIRQRGQVNYYDLLEIHHNPERLSEDLLQLELDGFIRRISGNNYLWLE